MEKHKATFVHSAWIAVLLLSLGSSAHAGVDVKDRYLVKFRGETHRVDLALKNAGVASIRRFDEIGVYEVKVVDRKRFKKNQERLMSAAEYVTPVRKIQLQALPNDPQYKKQSTPLENINAPEAWGVTTGSEEVLIAVSDTGISANHPDLKNQIWINPGEIPGNRIDDDQNGFIDDVSGWDYVSNDPIPNDQHGHGTHVAGIIGAEGNNQIGIAGVNWKVRILPIKFLDANGSGTNADGLATLLYANRMGARVVNCSWGGDGADPATDEAIEYLFRNGTIVIAAAGNRGRSTDSQPHMPSSSKSLGVISVGSYSRPGNMSEFTNSGDLSVDLVAPGEWIHSTIGKKHYGPMSGTSMAAPMVSGIAGLMLSMRPKMTTLELRNGLLNAVRVKESEYAPWFSTAGDADAFMAVTQLSQNFQIWPRRINLESGTPYPLTAWNAQGQVRWQVEPADLATIDERGVLTPTQPEGEVSVQAIDEAGNIARIEKISFEPDPMTLGCGPSLHAGPRSRRDQISAAFSLLVLPGFAAFGATRRRRRTSR